MPKSENTINKDPLEYKTKEDIEKVIASEIRREFEGKEIVKESELKANNLISNPNLEIVDDSETANYFEANLKTFDEQKAENNVKEQTTKISQMLRYQMKKPFMVLT